jgi:tRNA nucleotidyltransferase/poly(A) polymerase
MLENIKENTLITLFKENLLPGIKGVYLVGGSVRDLLLQLPVSDYDIAVSQNPEEFATALSSRLNGRMIPMGKAGAFIYRVISSIGVFDISILKGDSIETDLMDRDYTINAIAYSFKSQRITDPLGGKSDLDKKEIRLVSRNALERDPVRLVRAFRLSAALGFQIEPQTFEAITEDAHLIRQTASERILVELNRIFDGSDIPLILSKMSETRLLFHIIPELQSTVGCMQNQHHDFDVFTHTLRAISHIERLVQEPAAFLPEVEGEISTLFQKIKKRQFVWALLLHDVGKPRVKTMDSNGNIHFFRHAEESSILSREIFRRLKFSNHDSSEADFLIRNHVRPLNLFSACRTLNDGRKAIARFFRACGDRSIPLLLHAIADIRGKSDHLPEQNQEFIHFASNLIATYRDAYSPMKALPQLINGHDLMLHLNLSPSPLIKKILLAIEEARFAGEIETRGEALLFAKKRIDLLNP